MIADFLLALLKNTGEILMITIFIIGLIALSYVIPMWIIIIAIVVLGLVVISWGEAKAMNLIKKRNLLMLKINELERERCVVQSKLNQCNPEGEMHLKHSLRIGELNTEIDDLYSQLDKLK